MGSLYLGLEYDLSKIQGRDTNYNEIAHYLVARKTVAIFQGRSEAGPRALGNRSILYDPRDPNGKDIVNKIKKRESFRPFAASVLLAAASSWFDMAGMYESPHMMYAVDSLPEVRDLIPAVLHVDHTCRIQTVTSKQNLHYFNLITAFNNITEVPMLFNTSFNLAGDPLVETPRDAIDTFMKCELDYLYFPEVQKVISK
tara:strand:- start:962 stop:1558 length:597 start_codon:yes stop_codon:yes gene_type:complete